jgi:hypothetical protein
MGEPMTEHQNCSAATEYAAAVSRVIWRHKKRGTTYQVMTHFAALQCASDQETEDRFKDLNWTIYRSREDGAVYVRLTSEFMDGRFERIGEESVDLAQATPTPRCEVCDWPLAESREKGCVPGDCSYRPDDPAEQRRISERRAQLRARSSAGSAPVVGPNLQTTEFDDNSGGAPAWHKIQDQIDEWAQQTLPPDHAGAIMSWSDRLAQHLAGVKQ